MTLKSMVERLKIFIFSLVQALRLRRKLTMDNEETLRKERMNEALSLIVSESMFTGVPPSTLLYGKIIDIQTHIAALEALKLSKEEGIYSCGALFCIHPLKIFPMNSDVVIYYTHKDEIQTLRIPFDGIDLFVQLLYSARSLGGQQQLAQGGRLAQLKQTLAWKLVEDDAKALQLLDKRDAKVCKITQGEFGEFDEGSGRLPEERVEKALQDLQENLTILLAAQDSITDDLFGLPMDKEDYV